MARLKLFAFVSILIIVVLGLLELAGRFALSAGPNYAKVRDILLGDSGDSLDVKSAVAITPQPYLFYIQTPGFSRAGFVQHNAAGYRGPAVPFQRSPHKKRLLFLGGSTTYGLGVSNPQESYPAQVKAILEAPGPAAASEIEVINGGLEYGTSAELLTHYHFKYRYYRPDVVIVNTGGNDAFAYHQAPHYHPDYSHWRQPVTPLRSLPPHSRWLLRSRLMSVIVIALFYSDVSTGRQYLKTDGLPPFAAWYKAIDRDQDGKLILSDDDLAFTHNLEALISEILRDGRRVLLVPFRENPTFRFPIHVTNDFRRHERILRNLANKYELSVAPFPPDVICGGDWLDHCHLNARGERDKARHVAPYLRQLLDSDIDRGN